MLPRVVVLAPTKSSVTGVLSWGMNIEVWRRTTMEVKDELIENVLMPTRRCLPNIRPHGIWTHP